MKKFFSIFVIAGLVLVVLAVFFISHQSDVNKKEVTRQLAVVRQKFSEMEAPLRASGQPSEYARDQNEISKRYQGELDKLGKKFPEVLDVDHEKKEFVKNDEKKPPTAEQRKLRDEYFETTKAAYLALMGGNYAPELTGFSNGVRLDVYSLKRATTPEGESVLRADFIAWGFPSQVQYGDINMQAWVTKAADPKAKKKAPVADESNQEIKYKFDATNARPTINIPNPERWVPAFPPGATIGYYYLQLLPRDAEKLDLSFHYQMTTDSGRIVPVEVAFEKLPVTDKLMLPAGAKFEAQSKEASDAERQGRPEDEDTSVAANAKGAKGKKK
jgi:hypothetical protein